jgi:hypothetical protein
MGTRIKDLEEVIARRKKARDKCLAAEADFAKELAALQVRTKANAEALAAAEADIARMEAERVALYQARVAEASAAAKGACAADLPANPEKLLEQVGMLIGKLGDEELQSRGTSKSQVQTFMGQFGFLMEMALARPGSITAAPADAGEHPAQAVLPPAPPSGEVPMEDVEEDDFNKELDEVDLTGDPADVRARIASLHREVAKKKKPAGRLVVSRISK